MLPLAINNWDQSEIEAINKVLSSGRLTMGELVEKFEYEFALYAGVKHAVMFNSGSSANLALLYSFNFSKNHFLPSGSEIIVPAVSWSTTFYPVNQAGYKLVFVDIDPRTLNLDLNQVESAITENTRGIFAVNLLGNPAQLDELSQLAKSRNLILIEDNCESLGAELSGKKTGTFGLAGSYSFYFSHHICTMEGGMVTTNSTELAEHLKSIRAHGWTRGLPVDNHVHNLTGNEWDDLFRFVLPGFNLRPLEIEAAAGLVQLGKFPTFLSYRRKNAEVFKKLFQEIPGIQIQLENGNSSWFGFAIVLHDHLTGRRKKLVDLLYKNGIESRPVVSGNFLRNPVIKHLNYVANGTMPNADFLHENGLFIGNHHFDCSKQLNYVSEIVKNFAELAI